MTDGKSTGEIHSRLFDDVTVKSVIGSPTVDQFTHEIGEIYKSAPTPLVVWNMVKGSTNRLTTKDLQSLVNFVKPMAGMRTNGKTAMIAPKDLEYGMGRIMEAYTSINEIPFEFRVFRDASDAAAWLGIDEDSIR